MMITATQALSGMNRSQDSLQRHAHNLANLGTEGFRRSTGSGQATAAGAAIETDVVGQLQAKNAFLANLAVFRTSDAMAGSLLDALG